ncbi:MAG: YicC family protein [Pirellulales bacterium]|nr:YicC family protein [Pirellulales bacterium]
MTGFGEARRDSEGLAVAVEVRSINSRYLKISIRCGEGYAALEPQIESVVRKQLRRGTVQVAVLVGRTRSTDAYQLDTAILENYRNALLKWCEQTGIDEKVPLAALLALPGVINDDPLAGCGPEEDWPLIHDVLNRAIENLEQMRAEEGRAMAADLRTNCRSAVESLDRVATRAPLVVDAYRARLQERIKRTLAEYQLTLDPGDLIKEVGLFAERSDISEEIVRLRSHFEQFETIMELPESSGRKLEFLTQEMFREANTIGSKANDVEIAREVIEIKGALERIREMIQNVE